MLLLLLVGLAATAALPEPTIFENECPPGSGINLTTTRIISIGPGFVNSPSVTCLDLKDNAIEFVAEGAFDSLPNLKQLYLSNNQLNDFTMLFSASMPQLQVLNLTRAGPSSYSKEQLITGSFPALRDFSLSYNSIGTITSSRVFPKLERLDLSLNRFTDSSGFSAIVPETLKHLNAMGNDLSMFAGKNWTELTTLDLSNNKFQVISYENRDEYNAMLAGLKNLRELFLRQCNIYNIVEDAFTDTVNLEMLDLRHNQLKSLGPDVFLPLSSLKVLLLRSNPIIEIPRFQSLSPLTTLDMGDMQLTAINSLAFWWGSNLKLLRMDRNSIKTVYANSFSGLDKLEILDLSNNPLSTLPSGWCADLTSLRYLDLKNNVFKSLESIGLSENVPLHYLFFEGNSLSFLKPSSFSSMSPNITINLSVIRPIDPIPDIIMD